jgi:hypothetical protein
MSKRLQIWTLDKRCGPHGRGKRATSTIALSGPTTTMCEILCWWCNNEICHTLLISSSFFFLNPFTMLQQHITMSSSPRRLPTLTTFDISYFRGHGSISRFEFLRISTDNELMSTMAHCKTEIRLAFSPVQLIQSLPLWTTIGSMTKSCLYSGTAQALPRWYINLLSLLCSHLALMHFWNRFTSCASWLFTFVIYMADFPAQMVPVQGCLRPSCFSRSEGHFSVQKSLISLPLVAAPCSDCVRVMLLLGNRWMKSAMALLADSRLRHRFTIAVVGRSLRSNKPG